MSAITTHVLDTALGCPAAGVPVRLSRVSRTDSSTESPTNAEPAVLAEAVTDDDGRVTALGPVQVEPGTYQLRFDVAAYGAATGRDWFFPEVTVTFTVTDARHYHIPLLLSPFSYSTYRGS